jgi:amino-acid N-acetyltransferase
LRIRPATPDDLPAVEQLLVATGLPVDGVDENFRTFIVAEDGDAIAGVIGIERYGPTALLRSAAVSPDSRGGGIGTRLVKTILERAAADGVEDVYLLTTTAAEYFPRFGFTQAPRSDAPEQLSASREFQGACPATAVLMKRSLTDRRTR